MKYNILNDRYFKADLLTEIRKIQDEELVDDKIISPSNEVRFNKLQVRKRKQRSGTR